MDAQRAPGRPGIVHGCVRVVVAQAANNSDDNKPQVAMKIFMVYPEETC